MPINTKNSTIIAPSIPSTQSTTIAKGNLFDVAAEMETKQTKPLPSPLKEQPLHHESTTNPIQGITPASFWPTAADSAPLPAIIPANLAGLPSESVVTVCSAINANISLVPSNPEWDWQTSLGFEVCQEALVWLNTILKPKIPAYDYFPYSTYYEYKDRPKDICSLEHIAALTNGYRKFNFGLDEYRQIITTYDLGLVILTEAKNYASMDSTMNPERRTEARIQNEKVLRAAARVAKNEQEVFKGKVGRPPSNIDRSEYEAAHAAWKASMENRKLQLELWVNYVATASAAWKQAVADKKTAEMYYDNLVREASEKMRALR